MPCLLLQWPIRCCAKDDTFYAQRTLFKRAFLYAMTAAGLKGHTEPPQQDSEASVHVQARANR